MCHKVKRRNDVIVFTKKDYDFSKDEILELFAKAIEQCKEKVLYVCRKCSFGLRGVRNNNAENVYSEMTNPSSFLCTSCHKVFHKRKQVHLFKRKNYDFENRVVAEALSKEMRCKSSIYEFICVDCHKCLRRAKGKFPKFPKDVYCRRKECDDLNYNCDVNCDVERYTEVCDKLYSKNICDKVGDRRDMSTTVEWEDILNTMEKCCSFDELKRYVLGLKLPTLPNQFKGLQQMRCDKRDVLTFTFLPNDIGIDKSELFPVATSGYGSCFYYSLS